MEIIAPTRIYLSLGSNLGDRLANLEAAIKHIQQSVGNLVTQSTVYETSPWGFDTEFSFLNMCIAVDSQLILRETLKITQSIEQKLGREKSTSSTYSSRTIDIDIVFFGWEIVDEKNLQIPHPHYTKRRFVLQPLNEIAGDFVDPITYLTVAQLLNNCPDQSLVNVFKKEI